MAGYAGDIVLGDTIDIKFCTVQTTGAPFTLAGSPVISAYVGNSTTEITAGITLSVDFDGRTGFNNVRVVASSGNGFAAATNVSLVITTGTVNSVSVVGYEVGSFSLQARGISSINGIAATSITTINANLGATQPLNFTGTAGSALLKSDMVDVAGAAVSTSTAQLGVNAVQAGATAWGSGAITAASIASGAITGAKLAADTGLVPIRTGTAQAGAATTITLDASASATNSFYNNTLVFLTGGTGIGQARFITAYVGATKVATVATWVTNPDATSTFAVLPFDAVAGATAPTVAQIATAVWQDATAGDFTSASSIGKSLYTSGVVPGGTNGLFIAGTNAATTVTTALTTTFTGNVTGSVGSVTGAVGSVTGAVGSVTGAVGSVTGNVGGNVTGSVGSIALPVGVNAPLGIVDNGTLQSATGTTAVLRSAASFGDSTLVGHTISITGGTGVGQSRIITANVGSTDTVTVDTWTTTPDSSSTYVVFASAPGSTTSPPTANVVQILGTAVSTPATAGILDVNIKNMNNVAATSITAINANQGTTQPINFTGTAGSALAKSDVVDIAGAAVSASTAQLGVNVVQAGATAWGSGAITAASIASGAITGAKLAADTGLVPIRTGTAQAGAATTITLDAGAAAANSFYNNTLVFLTGGTGVGQARFITAYVGATKVATVATWVTNPDNTSTFAVLPFDAVAGASAPTAAQNATAVWQDLLAGSDFGTASSIGALLKADIDGTITSRMATYTQPTGFLAATFPSGTVANTINITAALLGTTSNNAVADAFLDRADAIETGLTPRGALRLSGAVLAGKASGLAGTTAVFRNAVADTKPRVTATVDVDGNRSAVATDVT